MFTELRGRQRIIGKQMQEDFEYETLGEIVSLGCILQDFAVFSHETRII